MQGRLRGTQRGNENANRSSLWGNQKKLLTSEGRMYLSVCVYPFSPHTKLSLQFRSSESFGERFSDWTQVHHSSSKCTPCNEIGHQATRPPTQVFPAQRRHPSVVRHPSTANLQLPSDLCPLICHQFDGWSP